MTRAERILAEVEHLADALSHKYALMPDNAVDHAIRLLEAETKRIATRDLERQRRAARRKNKEIFDDDEDDEQ